MDPAPLDLKDTYHTIKLTSVFTDSSIHDMVKTLLTHCEWFVADYMQAKLSANLWKFMDTGLHVYYQLKRPIT